MMDFLEESPLKEPIIFDSHAHYDDQRFDDCRNELLTALSKHGVGGIVNCGCDGESSKKALRMAEQFGYLYVAVGIHPGNIDSGTSIAEIEALAAHKKCVAIGEMGLDYYWTQDNKPLQKDLFVSQMELANRLCKPVIIHDREAHADSLELIKKVRPQGVMHSFSGSPEMAKELLDLDFLIGIGGVITFKNAKKLPDVVKMLPEDRILLETDAPYLTPVPYRSKTNHSAMIYLIAQKIAEIRGTTTESILRITFNNAQKLFGI